MAVLERQDNSILVSGKFVAGDLLAFLGLLHQAVKKAGYEEILIDFSNCEATFAQPMLGVCVQVMALRQKGVDFQVVPPNAPRMSRLFGGSNWTHLIDPIRHPATTLNSGVRVPAVQFTSASEQAQIVSRSIDVLLGSLENMVRGDLAAIEWALNEISDNVLVHANSSVGGIVQVSPFAGSKSHVDFIVCDAGESIPRTLRESHREISSDSEALYRAIKEGVTRDKSVGQGNGLFGSFEVCKKSGGTFAIYSGFARLIYTPETGLQSQPTQIPFRGTLVSASISLEIPDLLREALSTNGNIHEPVDLIETRFESADRTRLIFRVLDESASLGSRLAGKQVRTKLLNLLAMADDQKVVIDFSDIRLISSSFADEAFGKLFVQIGPVGFVQRIEFVNVSTTVRELIDRAISQRNSTGL